ncbi:MAG: DUF1828 domain-containing protein [Candidatus Poribacteria bacterium]|nr:DUF1828 domain-containing protein [Candidatus Poribacteria bacterium]
MIDVEKVVQSGVGSLYTAKLDGDVIVIQTPFRLPDGTYVGLYFDLEQRQLSDEGELFGWMHLQGIPVELAEYEYGLLDAVCRSHCVKFEDGAFSVHIGDLSELGDAVTRLAQAITRVADLVSLSRRKTVPTDAGT